MIGTMALHKYKFWFLIPIAILVASALPACSTQAPSSLRMASMADMPSDVQAAPAVVRQSYQFAAANPEVMKGIPCYCGCGNLGHTSNYSCYVSGVDAQSKISFDNHALGCSLCVNITQDTMRLSKEGKSAPEIKAYVDATYSKYGTSNMP
jgi:hypothetical protein